MSGRQSRVARKAGRVVQTELDREFNAGIAVLKHTRDETHRKANAAYDKGLANLRDERTKTRGDADKAYEDGRADLLKRLVPKSEGIAA